MSRNLACKEFELKQLSTADSFYCYYANGQDARQGVNRWPEIWKRYLEVLNRDHVAEVASFRGKDSKYQRDQAIRRHMHYMHGLHNQATRFQELHFYVA